MGKRLIIKGADFSANAIDDGTWLIDMREYETLVNAEANAYVYSFVQDEYQNLQGRHITKIRIKPIQTGTIKILAGKTLGDTSPRTLATLTIDDNVVNQFTDFGVNFDVADDDIIGVMGADDAIFAYYNPNIYPSDAHFTMRCFRSEYTPGKATSGQMLVVSFYGY